MQKSFKRATEHGSNAMTMAAMADLGLRPAHRKVMANAERLAKRNKRLS